VTQDTRLETYLSIQAVADALHYPVERLIAICEGELARGTLRWMGDGRLRTAFIRKRAASRRAA
jgi:hypothetical protein